EVADLQFQFSNSLLVVRCAGKIRTEFASFFERKRQAEPNHPRLAGRDLGRGWYDRSRRVVCRMGRGPDTLDPRGVGCDIADVTLSVQFGVLPFTGASCAIVGNERFGTAIGEFVCHFERFAGMRGDFQVNGTRRWTILPGLTERKEATAAHKNDPFSS